jgi:nucleoside-diphosphate-sugar epimerase
MACALIGYTGFVGGNLLAQKPFDVLYNSQNIEDIAWTSYSLIVCAGAPAVKWKANLDPKGDRACLERLMRSLERTRTEQLILISTVDVFGQPIGVDEEDEPSGACPYGRHRLELERFCQERFPTLVVRLPGLFGPGLRKNALFDLLTDNQVQRIDRRAIFQFYDLQRLWRDIHIARAAGLTLVHLATAPVSMAEVARHCFDRELDHTLPGPPPRYDLRSRYAFLLGGLGAYVQDKSEVLAGIRAFVDTFRRQKQCA